MKEEKKGKEDEPKDLKHTTTSSYPTCRQTAHGTQQQTKQIKEMIY